MKETTKLRYKTHTLERYLERYGLPLSEAGYYELCELCRLEGIEVSGRIKETKHVRRILVKFGKASILCVYDKKNNILRTVLPCSSRQRKIIKDCGN